MGLNVTNGEADPLASNHPLGTPAELEGHGYDTAQVLSCAVPIVVNGAAQLRGCPLAGRCTKLLGKKNMKFGGFGPPNGKAGTAGNGREYVVYSVEYPDGGYKEDYTWCYAFLGSSLYDWLTQQHSPNYNGPKVRLLGKAGEGGPAGKGAVIVVSEALPEDPNNNKTRNYKIVQKDKVVTVGHAPRFGDIANAIHARRTADVADEAEFLASLAGESAAAGQKSEETVGAASVEEGQIVAPRGRRAKATDD